MGQRWRPAGVQRMSLRVADGYQNGCSSFLPKSQLARSTYVRSSTLHQASEPQPGVSTQQGFHAVCAWFLLPLICHAMQTTGSIRFDVNVMNRRDAAGGQLSRPHFLLMMSLLSQNRKCLGANSQSSRSKNIQQRPWRNINNQLQNAPQIDGQ